MSGMEFLIPMAISAATLGTQAYAGAQQQKAAGQAQVAAERQRLAQIEQAATAADRERARLSGEGHMADRARKAKLAALEAQSISATGEGLPTSLKAGVIAALKAPQHNIQDQFATTTADKEFMIKTGGQALSDSRKTYEAQRSAQKVGLLADLLSSANKMNLGAGFGGSQSLPSTDPASWKTTVYR